MSLMMSPQAKGEVVNVGNTQEATIFEVTIVGLLGVRECFLAKMQKNGRIRIPDLTMALLKRDEPSLEGCVMEVTFEPA
jgi:hypothetical protein